MKMKVYFIEEKKIMLKKKFDEENEKLEDEKEVNYSLQVKRWRNPYCKKEKKHFRWNYRRKNS